ASNSYGICITSGSREVRVFRKDNKPNIISSNTNCGIEISDSSMNNSIMGNIIGLNRTCDDTLGNGAKNGYGGVFISGGSDSNRVINNLIGGNRHYGIMIYASSGNTISENFIGISDGWVKSLGNTYSGVYIITELTSDKAIGNSISHNQIGYNGGYGVQIWGAGSHSNRITENAISMNQQNGISLLYGGNKSIEHPVIQTATQVNVAGQSSPNSTVEVFCDGQNQGRFFLGTVTADGSGNFSLDLNMPPPASNITATATDAEGNTSEFSTPIVTRIEENPIGSAPTVFSLSQNYPNPFNPSTTIQFQIPVSATVEINIYNTLSQKVRTLVNGRYDAGIHSIVWDGLDDRGIQSACGIYAYTMKSADYRDIKKLILLK
ncbi:right-handed parallel beta-helix repeat-containing protein, partial [bacterium]|nr:right-handed parallel beta-helix repeat-containing protein [bacterium]